MKMTRTVTCVCAIAIGWAAGATAGDIEVTTWAAHESTFGMVVAVSGKGDRAYVEDQHPADETVYRTSFWFNPNAIAMARKTGHVIFQAVGAAHADGGSTLVPIIEIELIWPAQGTRYRIRALSYSDNQTRSGKYATAAIAIDARAWNLLQLEWRSATDNSAPDGFTRLSVIEGPQAGKKVELDAKVPDQRHAIDRIRLGAVTSVDAATSGSCLFDTFESYRSLVGS
jgi:hypothetical protein